MVASGCPRGGILLGVLERGHEVDDEFHETLLLPLGCRRPKTGDLGQPWSSDGVGHLVVSRRLPSRANLGTLVQL